MKLTIELEAATSIALRRLASELQRSPEEAAALALREALIGSGMLELPTDLDEGSETKGEA
ncbi:MAG: hypothetical protein PS018_26530 [bacterium]|nr:hypothetical protein [bacterium]